MTDTIAEQFDRLPPHSIESEQCTLASLALCGDDVDLYETIAVGLSRTDFYQIDHQIVFDVIEGLRKRGAVDAVLLREELARRQLLEEVGGTAYLAQILSSVPAPSHGPHYASIVKEKSTWRGLISAANDLLRRSYSPGTHVKPEEIGADHIAMIATIVQRREADPVLTIENAVDDAYTSMERTAETGEVPLIPTGFKDIDETTGGIGVGEMILLGARPSMGKSTFARQIAIRSARSGTSVGIISLEEDRRKLGRNWISAEAEIENQLLRQVRLNADQWQRASEARGTLAPLPIAFVDRTFTLAGVKSVAARMVAKHGIRLLIIDYLQKIQVRGADRFDKVTTASLEISMLLKELQVGGLILCQLNRGLENREDKRPTMSDLRESGQLEQDADGIWFLYREDYYRATDQSRQSEPRDQIAEVIIAKCRDGVRGGTIKLRSELNYQRFTDMPPEIPEGIY